MYTNVPDLVILLGARACMSFVGILLIVGGSWQNDRDKEQQSETDENNTIKTIEEGKTTDHAYVEIEVTKSAPRETSKVAVWFAPLLVLLGYMFLSFASLLDRQHYNWRLAQDGLAIPCCILSLLTGFYFVYAQVLATTTPRIFVLVEESAKGKAQTITLEQVQAGVQVGMILLLSSLLGVLNADVNSWVAPMG
jgi:hypothetical protein